MFKAWRLKRQLKRDSMVLLLVVLSVVIETLIEIQENYTKEFKDAED
jgi:hypothetical protein